MKRFTLFVLLIFFTIGCSSVSPDNPDETFDSLAVQAQSKIFPDQEWKDTSGNRINAHSGSVYYENGFYYWYGVSKIDGRDERQGWTARGFSVYRSKDLINWTDLGLALPISGDPKSDIYRTRITRPYVVYNKKTKKYVMIFKFVAKSVGNEVKYVGVATADKVTGPFTYKNKFLGDSERGSGDLTLFQKANGDLYHITVRRGDRFVVAAKMNDDYSYPTEYKLLDGVRKGTEGLAIFRKNGVYHLFGSGSNGWKPTDPRYFTSKSLTGPWKAEANPLRGFNPIGKLGTEKTFGGQVTDIINVRGKNNAYILMLDVHQPRNPYDSRYIWLPFKVENGKVVVRWQDSWNLGWFGGGNGGGGNTSFEIRARGKSGGEKINFRIDQNTLQTFTLSKSYKTYKTSSKLNGGINVEFFNDNGPNRDVQIDYIKVGGQTRQAEAQSYNTGAWGDGKCGGGTRSEMMQCNGVLGFGQVVR